jgi:hypothetical protein
MLPEIFGKFSAHDPMTEFVPVCLVGSPGDLSGDLSGVHGLGDAVDKAEAHCPGQVLKFVVIGLVAIDAEGIDFHPGGPFFDFLEYFCGYVCGLPETQMAPAGFFDGNFYSLGFLEPGKYDLCLEIQEQK